LPGEYINRIDHLAQTGSELPQVPIPTCPVDRWHQILLTSQLPGETTSELPLITDSPSDQEKQEKNPSTQLPPNFLTREAAHPSPLSQNTNLEKRWGTGKSQVISAKYLDWMTK
jgi:hypothetical protein